MNIGAIQPLTWFSIFFMVAAAGIAVFATRLKIRNDKLRKTLAELRARHERDERRWSYERMNAAVQVPATQKPSAEPPVPVAAPPAAAPPAAAPKVEAPETAIASASEEVASEAVASEDAEAVAPGDVMETPPPRDSEACDRNIAIRRAEDRAIEFASRQGRRRHPGPPAESLPKLDEMNPREALSEWLNKRAAARASQKTAPGPEFGSSRDREEAVAEPSRDLDPTEEMVAEPSRDREEAVARPAAAEPLQPTVFIDESLWESILGPSPAQKQVQETVPNLRFEVIQGAATGLPAGLQDEAVLIRLLESDKPFQGLAVAVGVSLKDGRAVSQDVMLHLKPLVRSLLEEGDFASQTNDDEFLLLCPGTQGADAQRRLSDLSERLWDFQLRGVGNFSIRFSTGDVQVDDEPLREAVAAASARLQQTRRARKMVSLDSVSPCKTASAAV